MSQHQIKFGMPTLIECPTLEDNIALASELGLAFVEMNMSFPQYQLDQIHLPIIQKMVKETGVSLTIHLEENMNVCDFNKRISDAYIQTALETIDFAKEMQIPILNMHMPESIYVTLPNKVVFLFDEYQERFIAILESFRQACEKAIGDTNILVCLENTGGFKKYQQQGIDFLLESQCFGLTIDIGHSYTTNNVDDAFIEDRIDRLHHMHMHDSTRKNCHLGFGDGELQIEDFLKLANQHACTTVIEVKTIEGLRQSVQYLKTQGWM